MLAIVKNNHNHCRSIEKYIDIIPKSLIIPEIRKLMTFSPVTKKAAIKKFHRPDKFDLFKLLIRSKQHNFTHDSIYDLLLKIYGISKKEYWELFQ